jgi:hypothetical protein
MPHRSCGPPCTQQLPPSPIRYSRDGSVTGSDRSMTPWIKVKIAVVPPIPNASVRTAVTVNTRAAQNCRSAYRSSPMRLPRVWPIM